MLQVVRALAVVSVEKKESSPHIYATSKIMLAIKLK
jgi:hypothetical protein